MCVTGNVKSKTDAIAVELRAAWSGTELSERASIVVFLRFARRRGWSNVIPTLHSREVVSPFPFPW
jgi:hypothetical protein